MLSDKITSFKLFFLKSLRQFLGKFQMLSVPTPRDERTRPALNHQDPGTNNKLATLLDRETIKPWWYKDLMRHKMSYTDYKMVL